MSIMRNQQGAASGTAISLILVSLIAIAAIVFGGWAFKGRQLYKNHADQLVSVAVANAQQSEQITLQHQYYLNSLKTVTSWSGPALYGGIYIEYPKTWSAYINTTGDGNVSIDDYFNPGFVPSIGTPSATYALRLELTNQSYTNVVASFSGLQRNGKVTIIPYDFPQVPNDIGVLVSGQISQNQQGVMAIVPLRTSTIEVWTESPQYDSLLTSQIFKSVKFSP